MTPAELHAAVLADLADLETLAAAAQPGGAWYREGRDVATTMPLLSPAEMAQMHPDEHDDWVFTAATTADAAHIVAQQPRAVLAQLAGRRRILERHAPLDGVPDRCGSDGISLWPCPDYRDAAADLLPEGAAP